MKIQTANLVSVHDIDAHMSPVTTYIQKYNNEHEVLRIFRII